MLILFGLIQLVPYGHGGNPPVTKPAVWPDARSQTLAEGACYDCHSNLTMKWWATEIAPASWLAQSDIDGGRNVLNFSEWDKPQAGLNDVVEAVKGSSMSRFRDESELSTLNRKGRLDHASADLVAVVGHALEARVETGGLFDH